MYIDVQLKIFLWSWHLFFCSVKVSCLNKWWVNDNNNKQYNNTLHCVICHFAKYKYCLILYQSTIACTCMCDGFVVALLTMMHDIDSDALVLKSFVSVLGLHVLTDHYRVCTWCTDNRIIDWVWHWLLVKESNTRTLSQMHFHLLNIMFVVSVSNSDFCGISDQTLVTVSAAQLCSTSRCGYCALWHQCLYHHHWEAAVSLVDFYWNIQLNSAKWLPSVMACRQLDCPVSARAAFCHNLWDDRCVSVYSTFTGHFYIASLCVRE